MSISVGTFNILHGRDYLTYLKTREETINLTLYSDAIRRMGLEICGLNEVRNQENVEGLCNQARVIGEALGYNWIFARAIDNRGGHYGNALVTKYPILSHKCIPMAVPAEERAAGVPYEDRVLLSADLQVGDQVLTVLVTHFGLHADEMACNVAAVRAEAALHQNPVILMGDLNFTPEAPFYGELCEFLQDSSPMVKGSNNTFPSVDPDRKIDYLFTNGLCRVTSAAVSDEVVSDHRPFFCTVEL